MTKEQLIKQLKDIRNHTILHPDLCKIKATDLLLQYVNDLEIDVAYMDIINRAKIMEK